MLEKCPKIGVRSYQRDKICATFGSSGNGLFAGFQELWVLLKSA